MITNTDKILHAAATVGAPDYLYDCIPLELRGHVYVSHTFRSDGTTVQVYRATAQGIKYWLDISRR